MKTAKKVLGFMLVAMMAIAMLAGCQTTAPVQATSEQAEPTEAAATDAAESTDATTAPETAMPATFKMGVVSPLTGAGAASGAVQANAVKMAVNEINEAGGINGVLPIELFSEDDEGNPAKSVTVTQKLVNQEGIYAMIGALNSSCTLANMEVTKAAGVPQITPSSSNAKIVEQGNPFIFRMTATDSTHAKSLLKYAQEAMKATKVAMIYESSDFGTGAFNLVSSMIADYGLTMVDSEVYNSGESDFSVYLTKIQQAAPDVIILWGYYTEAALICKQVKQYGIEIPIIGTGYNSPALVELGGESVNGLMFTTAFTSANPDPVVQAFDKKYTELFKASYDQNAPQAYDAVYVIADAVTRCMNDGKDWSDGEVLRGYIASTQYQGVSGLTSFDDRGEMVKTLMVVQIVDGKHTIVEW
jgi:branched-chain amino acid transport system substrate-binding protein